MVEFLGPGMFLLVFMHAGTTAVLRDTFKIFMSWSAQSLSPCVFLFRITIMPELPLAGSFRCGGAVL